MVAFRIETHIANLRQIKKPSTEQRILILLYDKTDRTPKEDRDLKALIRSEKAQEAVKEAKAKASEAKARSSKIAKRERDAKDKERTHNLIQSAGLLILAGLVDSKTGNPTWDKGELLGALASMAKAEINDTKRQEWKEKGDALLAGEK
ncbi:conjugal transfer protein TraD [Komagataeibacter oboediens]|uniref:conjugal transfer protein TraD n=1 Tax=Komagataeibacter oboediens TaxID=65958 RepID=UPI001C2B792A|nr:conjugal transfer protein TraD [Komagataeibacter oboediens]MBV0890108.1 conjugal transfer protein TraD [Komagataeibacter oboediens]